MEEVKEEERLRNEVNMKCNESGRQEGEKKNVVTILPSYLRRWHGGEKKKKKMGEFGKIFFCASNCRGRFYGRFNLVHHIDVHHMHSCTLGRTDSLYLDASYARWLQLATCNMFLAVSVKKKREEAVSAV